MEVSRKKPALAAGFDHFEGHDGLVMNWMDRHFAVQMWC
jgi:hypothetical protein